jgi:hypothetical protein
MTRSLVILGLLLSPLSAFADGLKCGPHEHVVEERDEEEGSKVKRCVCDEGWDADGPGKPCRQAKPDAKKPKEKK